MTYNLKNKTVIVIFPFILGILSSFSLPPYSFFFINFLTFPILLFFLILNYKKSKLVSFLIGWFFGFGYFMSNLYWISNALTFEENFKSLIPLSITVVPLFLGLFYGSVTLLSSFFNLKKKISSIIIFAVIFSLVEFFRGIILGGFPWNLIAFSLSKYLISIQILSFIGTYSLNLLCITAFLVPTVLLFE